MFGFGVKTFSTGAPIYAGGFTVLDLNPKFWALPTDETTVNSLLSADFVSANNEYLSSASTDFDKGNESFTYGAWFKRANATEFIIGSQYGGATSATRSWLLQAANDNNLYAYISDGTTQSSTTGQTIGTGWHFGVLVYDADNDLLKCSLDGDAFVTIAQSTGANGSNGGDFEIGRRGGSIYTTGQIDAPFFYNRALNLSEVKSLYQSGTGTDYTYLTDQNGDEYAIGQSFDGSTDAFNIDSVLTPLASTTTGEIELYVAPTDATPTSQETIISFTDASDLNEGIYVYHVATSGLLRVQYVDGGGSVQWRLDTDVSPFSDGVFEKINIVHNGTEPTLFIDDVEVAQTFTTDVDRTKWFNNLTDLDTARIGARKINSNPEDQFVDGKIQNVKIWSDATQTTQVAEWLLNDVEGANQTDSVGTYDATPIGSPVSTTASVNNTTIASIESSLVEWWKLNEPNGNRSGELGHTLTDNNTVGSAVGKIQEEVTQDGDSVYTVIDKSGTNNNALQTTVTNQPTWTNAKELDFDGSTDFLNLDAIINDVSSDTTGSLSIWINSDDLTGSSACFVGFGDTNASEFLGIFTLGTSGDFEVQCVKSGVTQFVYNVSAPFTLNTWHHVAVVQDGTEVKVYINGTLASGTFTTSTDKTTWLNDLIGIDNARLGVLNYNNLGNILPFDGSIGEVVITSEALTSGQVSDLYNSQKSIYA